MRVVVTGASGFVGQRLCAQLRGQGHEVRGFDLEVDVADAAAVHAFAAESPPDALVHLAAVSFVPQSIDEPALTYRVNYLGARSVLEAAQALDSAPRVLLVGSSMVYGPAQPGDAPFDEEAPLRPGSPYAWSKAAADLLGAAYAGRGVDVVRVRPFNHTGPGRPDRFVESSFARQIVEIERGQREPQLRVGNLDAVRDFLHVDDVIRAYARLLERDVPAGVYNIASGVGSRVGDLLDRLLAASTVGSGVSIESDPDLWRPADANVGNAGRLRDAAAWSPDYDLDGILTALLDDWRQRVATD